MKCEVVREGQTCGNDAEFIARTPWATQLACKECAVSFKRYGVEQIGPYVCDWPMGGKECGLEATHYFTSEGHQRPLCDEHARRAKPSSAVYLITNDGFDPKLVPYKPPVQPPPRVVVGGPKAGLWCWCGVAGKYRGGVEPMPLCDEHAPAESTDPKPDPPTDVFAAIHRAAAADTPVDGDVRAAFKSLALLTLQTLKEKVERWRLRR